MFDPVAMAVALLFPEVICCFADRTEASLQLFAIRNGWTTSVPCLVLSREALLLIIHYFYDENIIHDYPCPHVYPTAGEA